MRLSFWTMTLPLFDRISKRAVSPRKRSGNNSKRILFRDIWKESKEKKFSRICSGVYPMAFSSTVMGILRRLHTTPLRVWQYFLSIMFGNAVSGLLSIGVMFIVAILVFHLKVVGNYLELALFLALSIITVLGIGLAIGGWAKNERQAAPLANIIVFPMMFLSGTFFPRFLMPHWLQGITAYLPLSPVIDGARLITAEGQHLWQLGPQLGVMAFWLITVYFIAFRVFRWE